MNTFAIVKGIVRGFMAGAAIISFMHIVTYAMDLGLTWEAWTVPFFVDGLAILGKIGMSKRFSEKTRKAGMKLLLGAGTISLICNVMAGRNAGQKIFGVLVVAGFMVAEWYAEKLEAAPAPAPVKNPIRSEAAKKAAVTRKKNAAAAKKAERAAARSAKLVPQMA